MGRLIYSAIASLDGYIADRDGNFDVLMPDGEEHAFINDLHRPIGTYLYGRRLYEVMIPWETLPLENQQPVIRDFAEIWRKAEKVVFSRTLHAAETARTRIEPDFHPDLVRRLKAESAQDLTIGGAELAGEAIAMGLVDECHLFIHPVVMGDDGTRCLSTGMLWKLVLLDERRFASGVVHLHYRAA
ncbi:MAG TPA: dihydrofolate reductase family protein [Devosiaceae bacterium]|jgi:dihydrofolate reductase|nr:dihydrofolate reductase family protein [Devosiaceae bacterium]